MVTVLSAFKKFAKSRVSFYAELLPHKLYYGAMIGLGALLAPGLAKVPTNPSKSPVPVASMYLCSEVFLSDSVVARSLVGAIGFSI